MFRQWYMLGLCLMATLHVFSDKASAQQLAPIDSLFKQAQAMAHAGEYNSSRKLASEIVRIAPEHTDAILLIGRTFAWENMPDSARAVLLPLAQQSPPDQEALLVLADVELWAGAPAQSLKYAQAGLHATPSYIPFLVVKARALTELKRYKEAKEEISIILAKEPQHEAALALLAAVKQAGVVNQLRLEHQATFFTDNLSPWHLSLVEYTRFAPKAKIIARGSYAQRYSQQSFQGEIETYPQLTSTTYAYLNAGISDQKLFPSYRAGAEIFQLLPFKIEASLGARTLFFPSETVVLYTGHLGKYFRKQWVSFRPFFQKQEDGWQTTGIVQLRQYLKQNEAYITLTLAKGSTPFYQIGFEEMNRLDATRVGLEGQFRLGRYYIAGANLVYEQEEYVSDAFHHRITTGLFVQVKF